MRASLLVGALLTTLVSGQTCALTDAAPKKARYLKFCQDYNSNACCIPGHDLENQVQFENVIDGLGPGCKNPMMYPELRYFYCLGCDPQQPEYTDTTTNEIRLCKSFVKRLWEDPAYEDCGVMFPNPCPSQWLAPGEDDGMDPYTCGDDLLLPKSQASWSGVGLEGAPSGIAFVNTFKPPGLDDFTFIEVDDTNGTADCWTARAFKSGASRVGRTTGMGIALLGLVLPAAFRRLL